MASPYLDYLPSNNGRRSYRTSSGYGVQDRRADDNSRLNLFSQHLAPPNVTRMSRGSGIYTNNPFGSNNRPSSVQGPRPITSPPPSNPAPPSIDTTEPPYDELPQPGKPWTAANNDTEYPGTTPRLLQNERRPEPTYIDPPTQADASWIPYSIDRRVDNSPISEQNTEAEDDSEASSSHHGSEPEEFNVEADQAEEGEEVYSPVISAPEIHMPSPSRPTVPGFPITSEIEGAFVYTPPPVEKKKFKLLPFSSGLRFVSKLRKKRKDAPLQSQAPPSPVLPRRGERPIEVLRSASPSSPPHPVTSTPHQRPNITPLQLAPPLSEPTTSQKGKKKEGTQQWYIPTPKLAFPEPTTFDFFSQSEKQEGSNSANTSKSSHFRPLDSKQPDIIENLPNPHESKLVTTDPGAIPPPVQMHPQAAPDYERISPPSTHSFDGDSFVTHLIHLGEFLRCLVNLPFVGRPKTVTYDPGVSWRANKAQPKVVRSWYSPQPPPGEVHLDLLAPTTHPQPNNHMKPTRTIRPQRHRHDHHHHHHHHELRGRSPPSRSHHPYRPFPPLVGSDAVTAIRPTQTPPSATSGGVPPPSPGLSSRSRESQSVVKYKGRSLYVQPIGDQAQRIYVMSPVPFGQSRHGSRHNHRHLHHLNHHRHQSYSQTSQSPMSLS